MERLPKILVLLAGVCLLVVFCHAKSRLEHIDSAYVIDLAKHSESFANIFRRNATIGAKLKLAVPTFVSTAEALIKRSTLGPIYAKYAENPKYANFMEDLQGIVDALNAIQVKGAEDVTLYQIFVVSITYEIDAKCTAIMAVEQPGEIVRLAHNLDFTGQSFFRQIYIALDFVRDGRKVFSCSGPAGNIGGMMCTRIGGYSISINERAEDIGTDRLTANLLDTKWPTMWLIREVLTTCSTYEEAVKKMNETETVSGSYLSIAGAKVGVDKNNRYQGIILTRLPNATIHEEYLNSTNKFLIQCNTDWNKTNTNGTINDPTWRTKKGYYALKDISDSGMPQKFTSKQLRDNVLKSYPNLRVDNDPLVVECVNEGTVSIVSMESSGPNPIESWIYWPNGDDCLDGSNCKEREGLHPFCCCDANGNKCLCCPNNKEYRCYNIAGNMCFKFYSTHQMLRGN